MKLNWKRKFRICFVSLVIVLCMFFSVSFAATNDLRRRFKDKENPITVAELTSILEAHPEWVNELNDYGWSPLHWAAGRSYIGTDIIECLVAHGADVNLRNPNDGRTPYILQR